MSTIVYIDGRGVKHIAEYMLELVIVSYYPNLENVKEILSSIICGCGIRNNNTAEYVSINFVMSMYKLILQIPDKIQGSLDIFPQYQENIENQYREYYMELREQLKVEHDEKNSLLFVDEIIPINITRIRKIIVSMNMTMDTTPYTCTCGDCVMFSGIREQVREIIRNINEIDSKLISFDSFVKLYNSIKQLPNRLPKFLNVEHHCAVGDEMIELIDEYSTLRTELAVLLWM